MEDKKILELLWNRVEAALDALAKKFGRRLLYTAMNILGNPEDAEEAVNDTYIALWNTIPPERPDPLAGYVHRTGRNVALNKRRHLAAQKRNSQYDVSLEELAGILPAPSFEEMMDARELGQAIDRFLDAVSRENQARPLIHLSLPKFDVACETDLIEPMKALGITDVFDSSAADFSALVTEKEQPYLAQMSHAARVMIDEQGVTGAAFTAMDAAAADAPPPDEEIYFTLDRPFLFVIESRGGVPVFCGIVNEP